MEEQEVVTLLESCGALLKGHFELRSGLHSGEFFQCANALMYPDVARRLCHAAAEKLLRSVEGLQPDLVISPALGGIIVGHEVGYALGTKAIFAEKQDGILVMRRFKIEPGARVVVAEDVVTRGGRVQETIDLVRAAGAEVAGVVLIVDRSGGAVDFGVPTERLLKMSPQVWAPEECPLCRQGLDLVHPGS